MKTNAHVMGIICALLLTAGNATLFARQAQQPAEENARIPADQLDSLVAPIALYPDPLLSQTLIASTYPLELMQLRQWLEKNKNLKDKALVDAVSKQPWDPSIQAMAALPDVVKRLTDDIQWTTDLGNAFLAQQSDVMDAVQRMRKKAEETGALKSNEQQKVENRVVQDKNVIVVEQAQPDVVYVPSYNPAAVYGPAVYPYPSIYYPAYTPGVVAASAISFGVGVAMGAAWGGGWGWGAGWGHNDITINRNNNFNRSTNISGARAGAWQHNPQHRGGAPYANRATANRFGSNARGDSLASRQKGARQQIARQKSTPGAFSSRGTGAAGGNLGAARSSGGLAGRTGGGADRIGSRSVGGGSSGRGFGAGSSGFSGSAARSSSRRGGSSLGGGRSGRSFGGGGGRSRGGGGRSRGGGRR
jgi:hypothetical protein